MPSRVEKRQRSLMAAGAFGLLIVLTCLAVLGTRHLRDTALLAAVRAGDVPKAEALLSRGANIETRYHDNQFPWVEDDYTPLALAVSREAVSRENVLMVKTLLAQGANVSARRGGDTVSPGDDIIVSTAADKGRTEIVRLLLQSGANVNARTGMGVTPLMLAVRGHHDQTVRLLLEHGADPAIRDERGFTARNFNHGKSAVDYGPIRRLFDDKKS